MKRLIVLLVAVLLSISTALTEEVKPVYAYVTVKLLNGRDRPSKRGIKEALFDYGDPLIETGEWSADHNWIEVVGGETGTVWVHIKYVSEVKLPFFVQNTDYSSVKIRSHPVDGKLSGSLKKGKKLLIDQVVMGWGHSSKGWIDLSLVAEVESDDD